MSVSLTNVVNDYFNRSMGKSPYAFAWRGGMLGKKYAGWVVKRGKMSSNRRSYESTFRGVAGKVGSAPVGYGSAPGRITGSAPARLIGSAPEKALGILGDLPSPGIRRRKTSRIY